MRGAQVAYEGLPIPTNQSLSGQYSWAVNFVVQLRRIMSDLQTAVPDLEALTTDLADLQSRVTVLEASGGGTLSPQRVAELDLVTAADTQIGSIAEQTKRIKTQLEYNADATIHAAIEAHRATTGVRTQVSVSESQALIINSLMAGLGVSNANIEEVRIAAATGDNAAATTILTNETTVAGNSASITTQQASINGIYASSTISVSIGGRVVGTQTISGTPLGSYFDIDADYFRIGNASYANKPVFQIGTKNGVADIVFHGNLVGDGTITANALAANSVTAAKIAAGTITADKMNVTTLAAMTANLGTVTAGLIKDTANTYEIQIGNGLFTSADGKAYLDLKNKRLKFTP